MAEKDVLNAAVLKKLFIVLVLKKSAFLPCEYSNNYKL